MEKQEQIKIIAGISFLFVIIKSLFSFLSDFYLFSTSFNSVPFLRIYLPKYSIIIAIVIVFVIYFNKTKQDNYSITLGNPLVCSAVGLLLILESILSLTSRLSLLISNILRNIHETMVKILYMPDIISIFFILGQIALGIYLFRFYKKIKKTDT